MRGYQNGARSQVQDARLGVERDVDGGIGVHQHGRAVRKLDVAPFADGAVVVGSPAFPRQGAPSQPGGGAGACHEADGTQHCAARRLGRRQRGAGDAAWQAAHLAADLLDLAPRGAVGGVAGEPEAPGVAIVGGSGFRTKARVPGGGLLDGAQIPRAERCLRRHRRAAHGKSRQQCAMARAR
ncbi:hypothetical protein G6F23_013338 [Rhizopus arrhizus]|nr:hypothetical protein G6F23_013338 [Rhizopus arrhizus]